MGRRNTQVEPKALKTKTKSLAAVRWAGTRPWLGLTEDNQTDHFSRGSNVESTYWKVLHRPSELARITGQVIPSEGFWKQLRFVPSSVTVSLWLVSFLRPMRLLVPQGYHRIDSHRAACRDIACGQRDSEQQQRYAGECERIGRSNPEK
jgi:hypothetical protein